MIIQRHQTGFARSRLRPWRVLCGWRGLAVVAAALLIILPHISRAQTLEEMYQAGIKSEGRGDVVEAMREFRGAAEQGHAPSQYRLGWLLDGAGMDEQAVDWYRKSAEQGNADGQFQLGIMFSNGEGIEQDKTQAAQWVEKAASQGHSSAMDLLSRAHEEGLLGLEPDTEAAKAWLQRGLDADQTWAVQRKAQALRNGELGFEIDTARADELDAKLKTLTDKP